MEITVAPPRRLLARIEVVAERWRGAVELSLDEYHIQTIESGPGSETHRFVNHGPRVPIHLQTVERLIELMDGQQAAVAMFPEYTIAVGQREPVAAMLRGMDDPPILVVGGSACVEVDDGVFVNQAVLWMPRGDDGQSADVMQARSSSATPPSRGPRLTWVSGRRARRTHRTQLPGDHSRYRQTPRPSRNLASLPDHRDRQRARETSEDAAGR